MSRQELANPLLATEADHNLSVYLEGYFRPDSGYAFEHASDVSLEQARSELWAELNMRGMDEGVRLEVLKAEWVLFEAMRYLPRRGDGDLYEIHSYHVATGLLREIKGTNWEDAVLGLLHDTVEDSDGAVTKKLLKNMFGVNTADAIERLTKLRSEKTGRDLNIRTHDAIQSLIDNNIFAIPVKLMDRKDGLKTISGLEPDRQLFKARETLDYYVPLATAMGLHDLAMELAGLSLAVLHPQALSGADIYQEQENIWKEQLGQIFPEAETGIIAHVRAPVVYDNYKAVGGNLNRMHTARMPLFVTIIRPGSYRDENDELNYRLGIAAKMLAGGLIERTNFRELVNQLLGPLDSRYTIRQNGIPVRLIFVNEGEDQIRSATIYDARGSGLSKILGLKKINDLRSAYSLIYDHKKLRRSVHATRELLDRGAATVKIRIGAGEVKEYSIQSNGSVLDMAIWTLPEESVGRISRIYTLENGGSQKRLCEYGEKIQAGQAYEFDLTNTQTLPPESVYWIDNLFTYYGKDELSRLISEQLKETRNSNLSLKNPLAREAYSRGYRILARIFDTLRQEKSLPLQPLLLDVFEARKLYRSVVNAYTPIESNSDRNAQQINFLVSVGIGRIPVDVGRTSYVWKVAEELIKRQYGLKPVRLYLEDIEGALSSVISRFSQAENKPDIRNLFVTLDPFSPGRRVVTLWFTPQEYSLLKEQAQTLFNDLICQNNSISRIEWI